MHDQAAAATHGRHCPFLNRDDPRCSRHFSLDRLEHTFEHCFGTYETCPVYLELLQDRRQRRAAARAQQAVICHTQEAGDTNDADTDPDHDDTHGDFRPPTRNPLIQLTVSTKRQAALAA